MTTNPLNPPMTKHSYDPCIQGEPGRFWGCLSIALLLVFAGACQQTGPTGPDAPPNIVVIVADDLGYGDIGAYGSETIPTPHIDQLASQGVRLTDGYVSAAVCSPTRAGLFTGRYQNRFGYEYNPTANYARGPTPSLASRKTSRLWGI